MIRDIWSRLQGTDKPILLYGTGNGADKILDEAKRLGIELHGVFASDGFVRKREFRGFPVMSYSQAKNQFGSFIVLTAFGTSRSEVISSILAVKREQELYSVDVPVYGDTIFNMDFAVKHRDELQTVYSALADDFSRQIYENIIMFKLTGDTERLFAAQTLPDEAFGSILRLCDNEIYMDLGAFNGDTVLDFARRVGSYRKIYALEPDSRNFKRLVENTRELPRLECLNLCAGDSDGEIPFFGRGGRNAAAQGDGTPTMCRTVDSLLGEDGATYIKLDVEGSEGAALDGAVKTIRRFKPKLNVACYHRSEDIFALPLKILAIRGDYELHIRHYPYIPAWDTQFFFI